MSLHSDPVLATLAGLFLLLMVIIFMHEGSTSPARRGNDSPRDRGPGPEPEDEGTGEPPEGPDIPDSIELEVPDELIGSIDATQEQVNNISAEIENISTVIRGLVNVVQDLESRGVAVDSGETIVEVANELEQIMRIGRGVDGGDTEVIVNQINQIGDAIVGAIQEMEVEIKNEISGGGAPGGEGMSAEASAFAHVDNDLEAILAFLMENRVSEKDEMIINVLNELKAEVEQLNVNVNELSAEINILQDLENEISVEVDTPAGDQFVVMLEQMMNVMQERNAVHLEDIKTGDIHIGDDYGDINFNTFVNLVQMVVQNQQNMTILLQELKHHREVNNEFLWYVIQEIREGGRSTESVQKVLSVLDRHDVENLLKVEEKELEEVLKEARTVLRDEKEELEDLKHIYDRYIRVIHLLKNLREALSELEDGFTKDGKFRAKSIGGGVTSYLEKAGKESGYDTADSAGAGTAKMIQDMRGIEDEVREVSDVEKDEEKHVRRELAHLEEWMERYREAYRIHVALNTAYEDFSGEREEFLIMVAEQAVNRGVYEGDPYDLGESLETIMLFDHLYDQMQKCLGILNREEDLGLQDIEFLNENYDNSEKLDQLWGETEIMSLRDSVTELNKEISSRGVDANRVLHNIHEAVEINQRVKSLLGNIMERKRNEEKILENAEKKLEKVSSP